jgi:hypothetical protein
MAKQAKHTISKEKAKKILSHGEVRGHPLTTKQRKFMGARAGGSPMKGRKK